MIRLTDAAVLHAKFPAARIHVRNGVLIGFDQWTANDEDTALPFTQDDVDGWAMESTPSAPITPAIQAIADAIIALWRTTGLPIPADWDEAETALDDAETTDPSILKTSLKLLSKRIQLADAGGTWTQVLHLASITPSASPATQRTTP